MIMRICIAIAQHVLGKSWIGYSAGKADILHKQAAWDRLMEEGAMR